MHVAIHKPRYALLLTLAVGASAAVFALSRQGAPVPTCPPTLRVRQNAAPPTSTWKVVAGDMEHALVSAGFSDGPADERAFLKPDDSTTSKQVRSVTWSFGDGSDEVWLSCSYEGTATLLTTRINGKVSRCVITYDEKPKQRPVLKQIACQ